MYRARRHFSPVFVAGDAAFEIHICGYIVAHEDAVGWDIALVQHPDHVVYRIAGLYTQRLIVTQQFDQGQVEVKRRDGRYVVVVIVLGRIVAVA